MVESVKAASELYAPLSGEVVGINSALEGSPGTVNDDPLNEGWFMKIKIADKSELTELMSESAYRDYLKTLA